MRFSPLLCALLALLLSACGEQPPRAASKAASKAGPTREAAPAVQPKIEPKKKAEPKAEPKPADTSLAGFRARMEALVRVCLSGNETEAIRAVHALLLPDPKGWFRATFGEEHVQGLFVEYAPWLARIPELPAELRKNVAAGKTEFLTERFDRSDDDLATAFQAIALRKMKRRTPLYSLRLVTPGQDDAWHLWSFAWVDGEVRFVGRLMALTPIAAEPDLALRGSLRKRDEKALRLGK